VFGLSDRARQRWIAALNELNRGQGEVTDALAGRAQFRWTTGAITVLAVVGAAMVLLFVLTQQIAIPGVVLALVFYNSVRPPRTVGVTATGVLVAARGPWTSKPNKIIARAPFASAGHRAADRMLVVGDEKITFPAKEHARLEALVRGSAA
jgi:hypothetical protein